MHPQAEQESNFYEEIGESCTLRVVARLLRATTEKKVVSFFGEEKCTTRENPGYADVVILATMWTR